MHHCIYSYGTHYRKIIEVMLQTHGERPLWKLKWKFKLEKVKNLSYYQYAHNQLERYFRILLYPSKSLFLPTHFESDLAKKSQ